jgi:uncharacterized protein YjiS (DUF1127 family)
VNSLQIGLIAIGALVVAVLFLWHWLQSRRTRQAAAPAPIREQLDQASTRAPASPIMGSQTGDARELPAQRVEPSLDVRAAGVWNETPVVVNPYAVGETTTAPVPMAAEDIVEHASELVDPAPSVAPVTAPAAPKLRSEWPFDERLHVHASVVNLSGGPFDAAPFVAAAGRALGWVRLFRQSPWESYDPQHVGSVQQLVLALPLASRQGPIEAQDMDAWRFVLTELATAQGCEAHFHGFRDAPQRAAELDSFLAAVDIIPVAYLVKKDGGHWTGTRLRGTLEANGFRLQSDGRFAYHEVETDAVIFHAVDGFERPFTPERLRTEAIAALRCAIEPVRLTQPMARYDLFRQSIRALAKLLDADIKTSEGETLDDAVFSTMRDEVKTAMEAITAAGIEPGSDTARSLFG